MSDDKFNRCPFCGHDEIIPTRNGHYFAFACCTNCAARGPSTRIPNAASHEEVKRLVRAAWNQCDEPQHYEVSR